MGACACLIDSSLSSPDADLMRRPMEERANIGGDKIFKQGYTGPLFTLSNAKAEQGTSNLVYLPYGYYCHFFNDAKVTQAEIQGLNQSAAATLGKNGTVVLRRNLKIDICIYIVESIFIKNQNVLLRVRLFIELD